MQTFSKLNMLMAGAAPLALVAALVAAPACAQNATSAVPPTPAQPETPSADNSTASSDEANTIIVTGSLIRRTNTETASPIDAISNTQIASSGYDNLATALTNITANGAGTLSGNNSLAFAGGASGVALRGLSVGDTLTLVDGHRLAPYPLSDDGERQFTDIQSIPLGAIDTIEVDKDGASSIYGSDAIAGVINVKLKKQINGIDASAEGGTSQHGGGTSYRYDFSAGVGDLSKDGYNAFVTMEYRTQDEINLTQRLYQSWASENFTSIGGNDLRAGAPTFLNGGLPSTQTPYLVSPTGAITFLGSGCNPTALAAGGCAYNVPTQLLAPTQRFSVLAGFTKEFEGGWEARLKLSFFDSQDQQVTGGGPLNSPFPPIAGSSYEYPGPSFSGFTSNPIGGTAMPGVGAIANYTLPANYLGSGSAAGSYLEGLIAGVGLEAIKFDSRTYRAALDVTGVIAGFDVTGSLGFSEVVTKLNYENYVNLDTLYTDLTTFNAAGQPLYNPEGGNSAAVISQIAPNFGYTATDKLYYAEFDGTRKVADLPGGDLSIALGATVIQKDLYNPGAQQILSGEIGNTFSTYAIGNQTDVAEYIEIEAKLFNTLDINGSARDDHYNTYGNSLTPKIGITWKPIRQLLLRGTFSKGFRAPSPAESGKSATLFGEGSQADPVLCPNGINGPFAVGDEPSQCSAQPGYVQTTNPLKPETSTSFTGGAVFEPIRGLSATIDYYHIDIKHQIISAAELPTYNLATADCVRGPDVAVPGVVTVATPAGATPITGTAVPLAGLLDACFAGYVNAQSTETSGLDIQGQYRFKAGSSIFKAMFEWTHLFDYNLTAPNGVTYQLAGTHGPSGVSGDTGNPRDHYTASLSFENGPFDLTVSGYRISSFSITDPSAGGGGQATCAGAFDGALALAGATVSSLNSKYCKVAAFTSVNLVTSYKFNQYVKLTFSVDNLFDADAPFDAETYGGGFTPVNPALDEDGIIGRFFRVGVDFKY